MRRLCKYRIIFFGLWIALVFSNEPLMARQGETSKQENKTPGIIEVTKEQILEDTLLPVAPETAIAIASKQLETRHQLSKGLAVRLYLARGNAYLTLKRYGDALKDFSELLQLQPGNLEVKVRRAWVLIFLNKQEKAEEEARAVLQIDPKYASAYVVLAMAHIDKGETDAGILAANKAIALDDRLSLAYYVRAIGNDRKRQWAEALADVNHYLELDPLNAFHSEDAVYNLRGTALLQLKRYEEAGRNFALVIRRKADSLPGYVGLFKACFLSKRYYLAKMVGAKMVGIVSCREEGFKCIALAAIELRELDTALQAGEQIIKLAPRSTSGYSIMGFVLSQQRKYAAALESYAKVLELDKDHALTLLHQAVILAAAPEVSVRDGRKAKAIAEKLCQSSSGKNPEHLMLLATACAECDDFQTAIRLAKEALGMSSLTPDIRSDYEERLKCFEAKRPFRLPALSPGP